MRYFTIFGILISMFLPNNVFCQNRGLSNSNEISYDYLVEYIFWRASSDSVIHNLDSCVLKRDLVIAREVKDTSEKYCNIITGSLEGVYGLPFIPLVHPEQVKYSYSVAIYSNSASLPIVNVFENPFFVDTPSGDTLYIEELDAFYYYIDSLNNNTNNLVEFDISKKLKRRLNRYQKKMNYKCRIEGKLRYRLYQVKFQCIYLGNHQMILFDNIDGALKTKTNIYQIILIENIEPYPLEQYKKDMGWY